MKPIIGITSSMEIDEQGYSVSSANADAIVRAGGIPVFLPNLTELEDIRQVAKKIDGLYVTGGYDIDPTLFGEEPHQQLGVITPARDHFEILLIKEFLQMNKPLLAVCRGCQVLNIAAGGDMYQDIYSQIEMDLLQHQQQAPKGHGSHYIQIMKDSLLYELTGSDKIKVNSRHHQANRQVPENFQISGRANDRIIEAIESVDHRFVLGLQWHPENMASIQDVTSLKIYDGFISACQSN
ncbi:gamma-glutamyl-gamma-aminobutyrate hydrolase family protein [Radiobacillus sp. PE A8.2]|uniref:gamma-glutamyl-gamma-aminobutyrate hydrolase family protein n=1 Tax=Radiobacillus sp. PE A8.2 TaxID=3380349 RepID=UPI00388DDE5F